MKTYLLLLATIVLCSLQCRKTPRPPVIDIPGLPPATQTGANTLGFLLNGQPWTPEGSNGTANLSIDFDPGIGNGTVGITARRITINGSRSWIGIGVIDSLNFLTMPFTRTLFKTSIYRAGFSKIDSCTLFSDFDSTWSKGFLTIEKLDRNQRIIAGKFEFSLYEKGCDTIKVTQGRFDMKF